MEKIRSFLAIDIDKSLEDKIKKIQEILKGANAPVKFVEPKNLHFTVKFFGEITPKKIEKLSNIIEEKIKPFPPFELYIKGIGVFPNKRYLRVLWLGVENPEKFSKLQKTLDMEFAKMGFKKERSYIPHLTIGRVKGGKNKEILLEKLEELDGVEIGSMNVKELKLKKSELRSSGPIYTNLRVFKL